MVLLVGLLLGLGAVAAPDPAEKDDGQDVVFLAPNRPVVLRLHLRVDGQRFTKVLDGWVKELFAFLDRDGDGVLDGAEAERAPKAQALQLRLVQMQQGGAFFNGSYQTATFEELDENNDGKVTLEELTAYYRGSTLGTPLLVASLTQGYSSDALTDALFNLFDFNKDGKLTPDEMARADEVLAKLDANDDETLSVSELLPGAGDQQPRPGSGGMAGPTRGVGPRSFFLATGRLDLAQKVLARYDQNADQKLSPDEAGLDEDVFRRLDANGDGFLDGPELARLVGNEPDVEAIVRFGKLGEKESVVELVPSGKKETSIKTRPLSGGLAIVIGTARLDLSTNLALANVPQLLEVQQQQIEQQFGQVDPDKRGYLEKEDVARPQGRLFQRIFDYADRDGDGKLTQKELTALVELEARAVPCLLSMSAGELGRGLFEALDMNHDGRLSLREMRTACDRFAGDGNERVITKALLPRQFALTVGQGLYGGFVSPQVVQDPAAGAPPRRTETGPLWLRQMDANGDGDVARREWFGTPEDFKRIDADGDGFISPEEAARADAAMRKDASPGR